VWSDARLQAEHYAATNCCGKGYGRYLHELLRNLTSVSMWNVCGNKSNKSTFSIS
jgi:hypothetical protein